MESVFATFSQSSNGSSSPPPPSTVSDVEYYAFHHIDRTLFKRLIGNHGSRDPKEAIQIMGFWIWLEREVADSLNLVSKMLDFQMKLFNELCDEAVMCLRCVASETYPFSDSYELALMPVLVQRKVTFKYFYENRVGVGKGVARMVKEVCARAFQDILEEYNRGISSSTGVFQIMSLGPSNITTAEKAATHYDNRGKGLVQAPLHIQSKAKGKETRDEVQQWPSVTPLMTPPMAGGDVSFFSNNIEFGTIKNPSPLIGQPALTVQENPFQGTYGHWYPYHVAQPAMQIQSSGLGGMNASAFMINASAAAPHGFFGIHEKMFQPANSPTEPSEIKQDDMDSIDDFSHIFKSSLAFMDDEEDDSPDDKTIFLTFSRGYPISATEVKEFFTKKFGDFIESIHMQKVFEDEQVMFAIIIARSTAFVNAVVEGGRAKYNINGKHVWARKYVRNKKFPPPPEVAGPSRPSFVLGAMKF